jgi:hypothetical protein
MQQEQVLKIFKHTQNLLSTKQFAQNSWTCTSLNNSLSVLYMQLESTPS